MAVSGKLVSLGELGLWAFAPGLRKIAPKRMLIEALKDVKLPRA